MKFYIITSHLKDQIEVNQKIVDRYFWYILLSLTGIPIGIFLGNTFSNFTITFLICSISILLSLFFLLKRNILANIKNIHEHGFLGENQLKDYLLKTFNDDYTAFFGIPLNNLGDIDCFLVGPKGAFIIEAKNHKGFIRYTEGGWDHIKVGRKGTTYRGNIGNISAQISKQLNHIKHEVPTLSNVYVHKIICFTNPEVELIVEKEPKNLTVCKLENLKDCILNSKSHLKENEVKRIVDEIKNYCGIEK